MKQFADRNRICLLLVHHTRKQQAGDKFEMISGTTGLLGCADGAFLLQKEKRTDQNATLDIVGRDQPDQRLHLTRNMEKLSWDLDHAETELWKKPPDPFLKKVAGILTVAAPEWNGSATELAALLQEEMQPNILTRQLNVKAGGAAERIRCRIHCEAHQKRKCYPAAKPRGVTIGDGCDD